MGFTFDDTDKKGIASPVAEMERLIAKDPRNAERIFPYIGGEEVNDSPTHAPSSLRHQLLRFSSSASRPRTNWASAEDKQRSAWLRTGIVPKDYPDPVAADWPDLLEVVEAQVKPERPEAKRQARIRSDGGISADTRRTLAATETLERAIARSRIEQRIRVHIPSESHRVFEPENRHLSLRDVCAFRAPPIASA